MSFYGRIKWELVVETAHEDIIKNSDYGQQSIKKLSKLNNIIVM